jgi:ribosomal protein L29
MDGLGDDDGMDFDMQPMMSMNQQSQLFGAYSQDGSQPMSVPMYPDDSAMAAGDDANDANDAKRRRIARVRTIFGMAKSHWMKWLTVVMTIGMRHVSQEEDQVRRENAQVLTLHQLQDRVCFHTGGEETKSAQRVGC